MFQKEIFIEASIVDKKNFKLELTHLNNKTLIKNNFKQKTKAHLANQKIKKLLRKALQFLSFLRESLLKIYLMITKKRINFHK
jgi:hypothetical protein